MRYRRGIVGVVLSAAALVTAACTSGAGAGPVVTMTRTTYQTPAAPTTETPSPSELPLTSSGASNSEPATPTSTISPPPTSTATTPAAPVPPGSVNCKPNDPDSCFTPTTLKRGQKPPQFIVFSFDGVGWHQKWQYYQHIADRVPLRFTGFLTGLYLVDKANKTAYHPPGHPAGSSSLGPGSWYTQAEVAQEVKDLNEAYERGDEIGSMWNGHWCSDDPPGEPQWDAAQWTSEMSQFMHFVADYKKVDHDPNLPSLDFGDGEIHGERTGCLQGNTNVYFPVLKSLGFTYDSTPDRQGLYWPRQDPTTGLWDMGMDDWWLAGTEHYLIMMDWNFWYAQEGGTEEFGNDAPPAKAAWDGKQMLQTYWNMYHAAYHGNRAPIIIGNHFNDWNHNTYTKAIGDFMLGVCGRPDTYCIPFNDVVRWMDAQNPTVLQQLQDLPPQLPHKGVDDKPVPGKP
jgi:hypothetical protein